MTPYPPMHTQYPPIDRCGQIRTQPMCNRLLLDKFYTKQEAERVLIRKRATLRTEPIARLKRSPSNTSLPSLATLAPNLSYSNHSANSLRALHSLSVNDNSNGSSSNSIQNSPTSLIGFSNLSNKSYQKEDKPVHFTTPKISTDKWIPLLSNLANVSSSAFSHSSGGGKTDKRKESDDERIEKRIDDDRSTNGLIRIDRLERFDPIATSASDHLLTKNYHGYRREDSAADSAKKEPQVQYDEHEALLSLNELERRLKEQLELLANHKKSYGQTTPSTATSSTAQKNPIVHYEGSEAGLGSFRSLFNNDSQSPTFPPSGRIRLNTENQLQDVYAKINFSPKIYQPSQANHFANYQTNQLSSTESYFKSLPVIGSPGIDSNGNRQRAAKPAEVFYLEKTETEIPSVLPTLMPAEHQMKLNSSPDTSSFLSTYQPPIDTLPTFATSQPADEFFNHFQSSPVSPTPSQFRSFQNNQLQPYLYKPPMHKNTLPTATPLSYSSINPTNSISPLSSINYPKPTEYPMSEQFNRLPVHQTFSSNYFSPPTSTRISLPSLASIPTTYFPPAENTSTFRSIMYASSVPSTNMPPTLNNKIIESSSHLSQLNMSPQFVQAKNVAFLDHQSSKDYDLKQENNPNQIQYHLNGDDKSNYVLVSDHQSAPVTYRTQQFASTISPGLNSMNSMNSQSLSSIGSMSSSGSMSGSSGLNSIGPLSSNEMNNKLTSNQPIHVINMKSSSSIPDYVKVYDEKTNEMYFIKTSDFNQLKVTNPKLDVFDLRRPNKDNFYEPEATKELLKAVEAVKMAVIKVKPFKHYATRAVSDLASKLKDHLKSFAGSYSSFPYTDLSDFSYDMKRDPVFLQHFDEYSGKVLNGVSDKEPSSLFNSLKSGFAKPDLLDNDHLHIIEPISLNSDRDTIKQNVTLSASFGNSSFVNGISRQSMSGSRQAINNQTASFMSNRQKIDHFNRLIDEQKRSNQQKQQTAIQSPTQVAPQSDQMQFAPNQPASSADAFVKPGQTRYITKIAIKPNRAPIVQHFKYVQSVNFRQAPNEMPNRPPMNSDLPMNHEPMNHSPPPPFLDNEPPMMHPPMPIDEPPMSIPPMGMPAVHQIPPPSHYPMSHPIGQLNHPMGVSSPMNQADYPHHHPHFDQPPPPPPMNFRANMNDQPMIVQESKQLPTYSPQTSPPDNLTDYSLFPTDFLRLTPLNSTNANRGDSRHNGGGRRNTTKADGRPAKLSKPKATRLNGNQRKNNATTKVRLPEFNFEYNPRFSPVNPVDSGGEVHSMDNQNGLRNGFGAANKRAPDRKGRRKSERTRSGKKESNRAISTESGDQPDDDYLAHIPRLPRLPEYASLNGLLSPSLLQQLFNEPNLSINNSTAALLSSISFEPIAGGAFSPTPFASIVAPTGSAENANWLDQVIDMQSPGGSLSGALLSSNHPSMKYAPQSQLIEIGSLPILHHPSAIVDHHHLQSELQNAAALPFSYSGIKAPNLFISNNEQAKLSQLLQASGGGKQGQHIRSSDNLASGNSQAAVNKNKLDHKSSATVPLINNLEFLNPIKNRLQKFYRALVDGQAKKSRNQVTINFLNNNRPKAPNSAGDYEPMYKVLEFNEKNLREVLNGEEDAELLKELLADEKGQRRSDVTHLGSPMFGFNKRTLNTETMSNQTDKNRNGEASEDERIAMKKSIFEDLLRSFYENGDNLLKLSKLTADLNNQTDDSVDLSADQSTHSIDRLTDAIEPMQSTDSMRSATVQANNFTDYRQLIDRFNAEHSQKDAPSDLSETQGSRERTANGESDRSEDGSRRNQFRTYQRQQSNLNESSGVESIMDGNRRVNLNKNESHKQLGKLRLLSRLMFGNNRTGDHPSEKAVREKTQIEVYEREHFFNASNEPHNQAAIMEPLHKPEESRKVNQISFYHPSATWLTPTVVYDRNDEMPTKFGARRTPIKKAARVGNDKSAGGGGPLDEKRAVRSGKAESPKSESRIVESKQQLNHYKPQTTTVNEHNATKPGLLKAKEKGIKIITEFELVHKDLGNSSNGMAVESKSEQTPKFKVQVIDNGLLTEEKSRPPEPNKKLTFIDGSAFETKKDLLVKSAPESFAENVSLHWNNEEYLNNIRRQILKEIPNIEKAELERVVKQFQSQDTVSITPFSPTLSYAESAGGLREKDQSAHRPDEAAKGIDDKKSLKKVKKIVKKTLKNRTYTENSGTDFKAAQSQPDVTYEDNFGDENSSDHLKESSKYETKPQNCSTTENDEMNSKILNQINSLLEQQFRSLKDELQANRTEPTKQPDSAEEEESSPAPSSVPESSPDALKQTKMRTSYIPEDLYNIEKVNGVRRVINRPFVSNIVNQKKFQSVFKPAPIETDDSFRVNDDKKYESTDDEPMSNSNRVDKRSGSRKNKQTNKSIFDFQEEDNGQLRIGDYDSLY